MVIPVHFKGTRTGKFMCRLFKSDMATCVFGLGHAYSRSKGNIRISPFVAVKLDKPKFRKSTGPLK